MTRKQAKGELVGQKTFSMLQCINNSIWMVEQSMLYNADQNILISNFPLANFIAICKQQLQRICLDLLNAVVFTYLPVIFEIYQKMYWWGKWKPHSFDQQNTSQGKPKSGTLLLHLHPLIHQYTNTYIPSIHCTCI